MKLHKENQDCQCISSLVELASPMLELINKQIKGYEFILLFSTLPNFCPKFDHFAFESM